MWSKPEQLSAIGTARPVRVAYLVDLADCPNELLDAVFAEAYSRWGGRRTLIVPATINEIDNRYADWLYFFDADIIYSFVALTDTAVASVHERFAPAHLVLHRERGIKKDGPRSFRIELPFAALSSLSVLPTFTSRSWGFEGPPRNVQTLNKFWDSSESRFVEENFGFLTSSFANSSAGTAHPDLFTCLTLITEASLANKQLMKDARAQYVSEEDKLLEALGQRGPLLPLNNLSEFFAPYLEPGTGSGNDGMSLVAGDTPADRLLFWNGHHRYARTSFQEITTLRIPGARLQDAAFLARIRQIIEHRGVRGQNGRSDHVTLRSCSLEKAVLEEAAETLRKSGHWLSVRVVDTVEHAHCVPKFPDPGRVSFGRGSVFDEPAGQATTEFRAARMLVPKAMPWHMSEALPPAGLRGGNWMVDVLADRLTDHCRYINQRHVWALPRRLRLERAFTLEREVSGFSRDYGEKFIRPMRTGSMGVAMKVAVTTAAITIPDDLDAIQMGVCNDHEWLPFDRERDKAPVAQARFAYAAPSDKGRYLLGLLQLFPSVPAAFTVLMDGYWREVLQRLGAVPAEKNLPLREQFITTLRKRLNRKTGPLTFETAEQIDRLGREALRFGRMMQREQRYVDYHSLEKQWRVLVDDFLKKHPKPADKDDESDIRDIKRLDHSIQYLCQNEVLFQGREWSCRSCQNRNWVGMDQLTRTLECEVCGRSEPAPVAGDWHFRANPFVISAYRDHGIEAVVFAMWQLSERARRSLYFAPSLRLWLTYPKTRNADWDAEIDALAIVDGVVYLVEAKSAAGLDDDEIAQLVLAAARIRPDVLLIACMEESNTAFNRAIERLKAKLPPGVAIETLDFKAPMLDSGPYLPS